MVLGKRESLERRNLSGFRLVWSSLNRVHALPGLFGSIFVGVVLERYLDQAVPLWLVGVGLVLVVIMVWALIDALVHAIEIARTPNSIEVVSCHPACPPYWEAKALIVLRARDGLPANAAISFHRRNESLDVAVGFGTVQQDQGDGTYQVSLDRLYDGQNVDVLLDQNKTPIASLSARLEVSLRHADELRTPVLSSVVEGSPSLISNPATPPTREL